MKKMLLLGLIIVVYGFAAAQQLLDLPKNYQDFPSTDKYKPEHNIFLKKGGAVSEWFSPEAFIRNNRTGPFTDYTRIIFPDSTVVSINQDDERSSVSFHAWGHLFDLRHVGWGSIPNNVFAQRDNYTWDSLAFGYIYRRNNPDVNLVDTCFITYYKNSTQGQIKNEVIKFSNGDSMQYSVPEGLNQKTLSGTGFFKRDTILLTTVDTTIFNRVTGWQRGYKFISVGASIEGINANEIRSNPKSLFAATITFKPGHAWTQGDTVESRGGKRPAKGINYFGYPYTTIEGTGKIIIRYRDYTDNSLVLYKATRYGQTTTTGWSGFMPGTAFSFPIIADVQVKVSGISTVSVKEVEELGLSLGKVYPNPAGSGQSIFIEYGVKNSTEVTIEVYDMIGKKVATVLNNERVEAGDHKAAITLNLNPGVYFYTLSSGNTNVSSKKFTVIR